MKIIKQQAPKEQCGIHKSSPKNRLLILAALGFLLIGLTITNIPTVYSQSSSDMAEGGADSSSDGGADSSSDGGADSSSDGGADSSSDGGADSSSDGGADSSSDGGADSSSDGEEQAVEKQEICGNGKDDDDDGNIDEEDCKQQQQEDNQEICGNGKDDDDDGNIDEEDCKQQQQEDNQEICGNGKDDDDDGNIDEEDCKQQQQEDNQEICGNGADDDDDGKIDKEDSDCKIEICGNGADDDDDGKIDKEDSDCKIEICGNGADDDDDGKIDKEDSDCKIEICGNGADDDDDGKIDKEDSDCKAELRATGKFIVQVKNDNGGSKQPEDIKLRIKVSEGKASPSNFVGAGTPGTTVEFSGAGKFSVTTIRSGFYTESIESDCPKGKIPQTFTCTFIYDDKKVEQCGNEHYACMIVEGVEAGGSLIGKISSTGPPKIIPSTPPDPNKGGSTSLGPNKGGSTSLGPETGPGIQEPPLTPQPLTTYNSDEKSVSVKYPNDWQISENANNVTFKSPPESSSDRFEEALRVLKVPYKDPLSSLTEKIIGDAKANLPSFQIINSTDTVLGGIPANSLVYTYTDNTVGALQEMVILTIKDDSAYIIGFIAELPKYDYYLPVIQEMINSIELSDNKSETSSLLPFIPQQLPSP